MSVICDIFGVIQVDEVMAFDLYINRERKKDKEQTDQYVSVSACKGFFIVMGVFGHGWGVEKFVNHELTESIFL
jgi:hypothetical protein